MATGSEEDHLPVVLVRMPYRSDARSECGGPDSPYFLKAWLHELGHALHHIASAAACRVTAASKLVPPFLPKLPTSRSRKTTPSATSERPGTDPKKDPPPPTWAASGGPTSDTLVRPSFCLDGEAEEAGGGGVDDDDGNGDGDGDEEHEEVDEAVDGSAGWRLALLSGSSCPLDVREIPSHLMEHLLRDQECVRQLSRHGRLDCPLPQKDCIRLVALLSSCFTSTVGELQRLVAAALADQLMHGPATQTPPPQVTPAPAAATTTATAADHSSLADAEIQFAAGLNSTPMSPLTTSALVTGCGGNAGGGSALRAHLEAHGSVCSLTSHHYHDHDQQQQQQLMEDALRLRRRPTADLEDNDRGVATEKAMGAVPLLAAAATPPLLVSGPDVAHHLEAAAVLGGVQYVYVASRLFAAAIWRAHMQDHLPCGNLAAAAAAAPERIDDLDPAVWRGQGSGQGERMTAGRWLVRRRLLEAGAHSPGIDILRGLLGRDAFLEMAVPCREGAAEGELKAPAAAEAGLTTPMVGVAVGGGFNDAARCVGGCRDGGLATSDACRCRCWVPDLGADVFQDVDLLG
ncbi:hypothetical protein Vretifemale_1013 [Volvox reticuliferus]|uniref:Peptidase M3A/M3B catalytic domain-containing protein n=2 Tax=Volvox reticuliferus TaxID=1737510 RepID=A0A8J4FFN4_9CHLO|nr:hypothetical protein Vretifemale_1013 [Volvox reticuliferus]